MARATSDVARRDAGTLYAPRRVHGAGVTAPTQALIVSRSFSGRDPVGES